MTVISKSPHTPLISIIVVTFNAVQHLRQTIDSITALEYPRVQLIVIDGGSKDGTVDIIRDQQKSIHYWVSEKDNGIYDAFNKGWNVAAPDSYVLYLGAGDKILTLPRVDTVQGADVVYGKVIINEKLTFHSKVGFRLKLGNTLHHQALLVKKSLAPVSPFNLQFRTYADFDFNQRLLKQNVKFVFDEAFVSYALPGGVSQQFNTAESLRVVQKNFGKVFSALASIYYALQRIKARIS